MNVREQAELRDRVARERVAAVTRNMNARRAAGQAKRPPKVVKPSAEETELAARLLAFCAAESTVDRERHALAVARMILKGRR